jgi:uncharacterized membrane protein
LSLSQSTLERFADFALVGTVAILLALPVLVSGPLVQGHDTYEHVAFAKYFTEQFWAGDWYPRWLIGINHGLGSPSFFVFPPLPAFVVAILTPAAAIFGLDAFRIAEFSCLLTSGLCAYLWLTTMTTRRGALIVSMLYMLMPYHLVIDFYRRTALPECWALAWAPLVLYYTSLVLQGKHGAVSRLAIAYALLIFSHLITVFMFSLVPLLLAAVEAPRGDKMRRALQVAGGMCLGAGLSSFYLCPALFHSKYFSALRVIQDQRFDIPANLIGRHFYQSGDEFFRTVSWCLTSTAVFILFCVVARLFSKNRLNRRRTIALWLAVSTSALFLMTKLSLPIWTHIPQLAGAVQYPWRFNVVVCLAFVPIAAAFLDDWNAARSHRLVAIGLTSSIIVTWLTLYSSVRPFYKTVISPRDEPFNTYDGWFAAWPVPGLDQTSALVASTGPRVRFIVGDGDASVVAWKPRTIRIHASSTTGGTVVVNQFYYPLWVATDEDGGHPFTLRPAMPQGLIGLNVPQGLSNISITLPKSAAEHFGNWLSLFSAMFVGALLVGLNLERRPGSQVTRVAN